MSLERWRDFAPRLERDAGVSVDYRNDGVLGLAFDAAEKRRYCAACENLLERGAAVALVSAQEARALVPGLAESASGGLFALEDGQADPRRLMEALRLVLEKAGVERIAGRCTEVLVSGGAACGVRLDDGRTIAADAVVLAAGASVAKLQVPMPRPPVFPVKGEAVALSMPAFRLDIVARAPGAYLCPKADGRLVIGATEVEGDETLEPSPSAIEILKCNAARAFPPAASFPEVERWAGLRPATPDGAPILGRDPRGPEHLFLALGHYRNGVLLAPESAEVLARLILGGEESPFLAAFRPDRFPEV
jgi:glycine oxidase